MRQVMPEKSGERIREGVVTDRSSIPAINQVMHPGTEAVNAAASFTQRVGTGRLACGIGAAIGRFLPTGESLSVRWQHPWNVAFAGDGEKVS